MLRLIIILSLVAYVMYKVGSFFFKAGAASQELKDFKQQQNKTNAPKNKKGKIGGGEYVDYEEVK